VLEHFADRLADVVRRAGTPLCVGLDPRWEQLPVSVRRRYGDSLWGRARAYEEFCFRVLDVAAGRVGVVKPQMAFFEACGEAGYAALRQVVAKARGLGLVVILDGKRHDIASTAQAYAEAAFEWLDGDAVTVSPYLGADSVEPFLSLARPRGRGVFVLVRTSNPSAAQFQELPCQGQKLYQQVAQAVHRWSRGHLGRLGLGDVGAVVAATCPEELAGLRQALPCCWFLVPGYGAQGGTAADVAGAFLANRLGAVVNSSRAILYPYSPDAADWESLVETAIRQARQDLGPIPS
jgi:orotidine-5'-phosphate decarboxylase